MFWNIKNIRHNSIFKNTIDAISEYENICFKLIKILCTLLNSKEWQF